MRAAALALALVAACAGVVARFAWLGRATFFADETVTAQRVSGRTDRDVNALFDGRIRPAREVHSFVDDPAGPPAIVAALATDEPQHPPLFYLIERGVVGVGGTSAVAFRVLPAALGVLGIALAWLLGLQLFRTREAAAVAAALVAVGPFFVEYARQAREFGLLVDVTLAACVALLWAFDRPASALRWCAFCALASAGLYTTPLFGLVLVGFVATLCFAPGPPRMRAAGFAAAVAVALAAFAPWMIATARAGNGVDARLAWAMVAYPVRLVVAKWAFALGALGFDLEYVHPALAGVAAAFAAVAVVALVVLGARATTPQWRRAAALLLPLVIVPLAYFVFRDAVQRAHFATIPRYLTTALTGAQFATAGMIGSGLSAARTWVRAAAFAAFAAFVAAGIASAAVQVASEDWWPNHEDMPVQSAVRTIDTTAHPLVVVRGASPLAFELARYLPGDTEMLLLDARTPFPRLPKRLSYYVEQPPASAEPPAGFEREDVTPRDASALGVLRGGLGQRARSRTTLWRLVPRAGRARAAQ